MGAHRHVHLFYTAANLEARLRGSDSAQCVSRRKSPTGGEVQAGGGGGPYALHIERAIRM